MKHLNKKLCALLFSFIFIQQSVLSNNEWVIYPSYKDITEIEPTGKNVFVLASKSIYSYNPSDGQIITYDKRDLSDTDIEHIAWIRNTKKLVVAYKNSNIDLLSSNGEVENISGLLQAQMTQSKEINSIYVYNEFAYLATKFGIVKLDTRNGVISNSYKLNFSVEYCYIKDNKIFAVSKEEGTYSGELDKNLLDRSNWNKVGNYTPQNINHKNVYDSANKFWWTTTDDGKLTYYKLGENNNRVYLTEGIRPDGPSSNYFYRIYLNNNKLYGIPGVWSQEAVGYRHGAVHVWDGEKWDEFEDPTDSETKKIFEDLVSMDFDPKDNEHVMIGSKNGLYEFRNKKFVKHYNHDNSDLRSPFDTYKYTLVTSVKYDADGNLWALNSLVPRTILKYSQNEDKWTSFQHKELSDDNAFDLGRLFISPTNGKMWFVNNYYKQTMLFSYDYQNDKLTSYGPSLVNQDGKDINANYIYSPKEDNKGNIWIGTDQGILYLSASDISKGNKTFIQHKVPRNDGTNFADYLLANMDIRSIAIDGGNRKWIGTNGNGAFLISDDNNEQIFHFTTENSPITSNTIQDIAIDGNTGIVYFATDKGLCSYQSNVTSPSAEIIKDDVYAYPNPVTPDYTGQITIVGLTYNADIKIVTTNGTLVNSGKSTGGTYSWDGRDLNGHRVASGIYMVEIATAEGEKGTVCKIAIIN